MIGSSRSYAIGMAHFQIAGGMRTLITICGAYIALVCIILSWLYYNNVPPAGPPRPIITGDAVGVALLLQAFILLFFGNFRIMAIVRMDVTNKMIESHRMMPIPSWRAVAGYMLGGTSHAIAFALLNVALAYIFAAISGTNLSQLTVSEAVLALFVLFLWSAATLGAMRGRAFGAIFGMCISFGFIGGRYLYGFLPGVALLVSPIMGNSVFIVGPGATGGLHTSFAFAILAQAAFFSLFFAGACRLYRGTFTTTFSLWQAMALLATWTATSIAGIILWHDFHARMWMITRELAMMTPSSQLTASLIVAMLLTVIPVRTLIFAERQWSRKMLLRCAVLLAIIITVSLLPLGILNAQQATPANFLVTALIVASHVICVYLLMRIMRRAKQVQAFLAVAIPTALIWFGPLAVELFLLWIAPTDAYGNRPPPTGFASSFSPPGLLAQTWAPGDHVSPIPGLIFQSTLPILLGLLMLKTRAKRAAEAQTIVPTTYDRLAPSESQKNVERPPSGAAIE